MPIFCKKMIFVKVRFKDRKICWRNNKTYKSVYNKLHKSGFHAESAEYAEG